MTDAIAAKGTKIQWDNNGTWETIGEVKSGPEGPSESVETADATHHASPNDAMEHVPTLVDAGEVTLGVSYTQGSNQHDKLRTKKENFTLDDWRILSPGSNYALEFSAHVTGLEMSFNPDELINADVTLNITGAVTENSSP